MTTAQVPPLKQRRLNRLARWFCRAGVYALCGFLLGIGVVRVVRLGGGQQSAQYVAALECESIRLKVIAKFSPTEPPDDDAHKTEHRAWGEKVYAELKSQLDPIVRQLPAPKVENTATDVFDVVRVESPTAMENGFFSGPCHRDVDKDD